MQFTMEPLNVIAILLQIDVHPPDRDYDADSEGGGPSTITSSKYRWFYPEEDESRRN